MGVFGAVTLEKDPKVWSYGIEYTPVPLVSGFLTQKNTERGRTEFGLNFTYYFQMPWGKRISQPKVAELRIVGDSRHESVDRENRIILEYRAKHGDHGIEHVGPYGNKTNEFIFRVEKSFDGIAVGETVRVTALAKSPGG